MTSTSAWDTIPIRPSILYFGTPVVLLTTENDDGTPNLAPMSSAWALGQTIVLGVSDAGQTGYNLRQRPDLVINVPGPDLWRHVERLAGVTGRDPVPETKPAGCRFVADKFGEAGLTPRESELVRPPRVAECPLQFEARAARVQPDSAKDFLIVEAEVVKVV